MEKTWFARLRRKGNSRFVTLVWLCLFILCVSLPLILMGLFVDDSDSIFWLIFGGGFALFGLGMLMMSCRKCLVRRKRVLRRYQALTPSQQRDVETDLDGYGKLKTCLFCAHTMYFPDAYGLGVFTFLPYSEIAWAYVKTSMTPMAGSDNVPEEGMPLGRASILHIYDKAGQHYLLNSMDVNRMGIAMLNQIAERAPWAVIGYTKERKAQAKRDISALK